jgi:hypothetical protein
VRPAFPDRLERFASVDSTQAIVRSWLATGGPRGVVAVADVQTAGRGRLDRSWTAPSGTALLCSIGFRPVALPASHAWRLGATVSLAMLDAAEDVAGLRDGRLALKWPNDLVALMDDGQLRKVAGVLGESVLGTDGSVVSAVVGIGVNADWAAADFRPPWPARCPACASSLAVVPSIGRPSSMAFWPGWNRATRRSRMIDSMPAPGRPPGHHGQGRRRRGRRRPTGGHRPGERRRSRDRFAVGADRRSRRARRRRRRDPLPVGGLIRAVGRVARVGCNG